MGESGSIGIAQPYDDSLKKIFKHTPTWRGNSDYTDNITTTTYSAASLLG